MTRLITIKTRRVRMQKLPFHRETREIGKRRGEGKKGRVTQQPVTITEAGPP